MKFSRSNRDERSQKLPMERKGMSSDLFRPLRELQRSIDRLFEDVSLEGNFPDWSSRGLEASGSLFYPPCEIEEKDNEFRICLDTPGMSEKDIEIEVRDNNLVVSGSRSEEKEKHDRGRRFSERTYGSFYRSFALPSNINEEDIKANYENGVLEITVPKTEATKSRKITIGEGAKQVGTKAAS